jgi:hypothetical protein
MYIDARIRSLWTKKPIGLLKLIFVMPLLCGTIHAYNGGPPAPVLGRTRR